MASWFDVFPLTRPLRFWRCSDLFGDWGLSINRQEVPMKEGKTTPLRERMI